jgi:hypothetical protein
MANNRIQIKRSVANATVSGLSNGELAFTQASNTLHIGLPDGTGVLRIGGAQYPGVLTNNQALVANATGGIDKVIVANAVVTSLVANGSAGSNGQVLVTNGSAVYWGTGTSGANTYVQFNDSGVANGVSGFTFDKVTNTLYTANNVWTSFVNASAITIGSSLVTNSTGLYHTGTVNAAVLSTAGNLANTSGVYPVSNTVGSELGRDDERWIVKANTIHASGLINGNSGLIIEGTTNTSVAFNIPTSFVANSSGLYHTGTVNSTSFNVGNTTTGVGGVYANSTTVVVGNSSVNTQITQGVIKVNDNDVVANSSGVFVENTVNALSYSIGTAYTVNSTSLVYTGESVNATSATLNVRDANITGNLFVSGAVVTVNVSTIQVNDNIIELAYNNNQTDLVDTGWYSPAGNNTNVWYSGLVRVAGGSSAGNPYFKLFSTSVNPNTSTTVDINAATGTLQAYLAPYGINGALVANSSNVQITANSTLGVNFVANSLTLSTALAGTEGGTGYKTSENQSILVGNATNGYNKLSLGSEGYVLQSNGSALLYDYLDGGSF